MAERVLLNCNSPETAAAALAEVAGVEPPVLVDAIRAVSWDEIWESDDPDRALKPLVEQRLGLTACLDGLTAARYFHGTRTVEPERYWARGLLPLSEVVEQVWSDLRAVGVGLLDDAAFERLRAWMTAADGGDSGHLYAFKVADAMHHGPFGVLVRDHLLRAEEVGDHRYLRIPELVEDICNVAQARFGADLETAFLAAAKPCVVAFDAPDAPPAAINAALYYLREIADGVVTRNSAWGFDGHGSCVPAKQIVAVEVLGGCG